VNEVMVVGGMVLAVAAPKVLPMLLLPGHLRPGVRRWLAYVAPAVLSALVAPAILAPGGALSLDARLLSYATAFVTAVLTRGMLRSLAAGLVVAVVLGLFRPASGL
jgi:branched-subunit amino acid transport protein